MRFELRFVRFEVRLLKFRCDDVDDDFRSDL